MPVTVPAIRAALNDLNYPANKHDLLACARRNGADGQVERAPRAVAPRTDRNVDEVLASVRTDEEPAEEADPPRAERRRQHIHRGLTERDKDI